MCFFSTPTLGHFCFNDFWSWILELLLIISESQKQLLLGTQDQMVAEGASRVKDKDLSGNQICRSPGWATNEAGKSSTCFLSHEPSTLLEDKSCLGRMPVCKEERTSFLLPRSPARSPWWKGTPSKLLERTQAESGNSSEFQVTHRLWRLGLSYLLSAAIVLWLVQAQLIIWEPLIATWNCPIP